VTALARNGGAMDAVLEKLQESGAESRSPTLRCVRRAGRSVGQHRRRPYPGFPTDVQAQFMAYMCLGDGLASCGEIFENRFMHVAELRRMGGRIDVSGNTAVKGCRDFPARR